MNQEELRSTYEDLAIKMLTMHRNLRGFYSKEGLTRNQLFVLSYLYRHDVCKVTDICRAIEFSPSTVTDLCDELESMHFVERRRSTEDRRVVHVHLTEEGRHKLESVRNHRVNQLMEIFSQFDQQELCSSLKFMTKFNETFEQK